MCDQPGLQSEFQECQNYIVRPVSKKQNKKPTACVPLPVWGREGSSAGSDHLALIMFSVLAGCPLVATSAKGILEAGEFCSSASFPNTAVFHSENLASLNP